MPATGSIPYTRLMAVVTKYLSVRTAMTLVNKALVEVGLTPDSMVMGDLPSVIEATMSSLRAFVPDAQMDELILDLSSISSLRALSDEAPRLRRSEPPASFPYARSATVEMPALSKRPSSVPPAMSTSTTTRRSDVPAPPSSGTRRASRLPPPPPLPSIDAADESAEQPFSFPRRR